MEMVKETMGGALELSPVLIFGDAKYSQALKYKPCIGKISMVYLCKSK